MEEHVQIHTLATFPWECTAGIQCVWGLQGPQSQPEFGVNRIPASVWNVT
jgi:hypothetical protein